MLVYIDDREDEEFDDSEGYDYGYEESCDYDYDYEKKLYDYVESEDSYFD